MKIWKYRLKNDLTVFGCLNVAEKQYLKLKFNSLIDISESSFFILNEEDTISIQLLYDMNVEKHNRDRDYENQTDEEYWYNWFIKNTSFKKYVKQQTLSI